VLVDLGTDATHTQPLMAALMAGAFLLVVGEGGVYSTEDVRDWLQATGWRMLEGTLLEGSLACLWPRKPNNAPTKPNHALHLTASSVVS
jgi:hypothetical protein